MALPKTANTTAEVITAADKVIVRNSFMGPPEPSPGTQRSVGNSSRGTLFRPLTGGTNLLFGPPSPLQWPLFVHAAFIRNASLFCGVGQLIRSSVMGTKKKSKKSKSKGM
jgi:hypothetical protein